jgi:HD-GYP domain-containing protein (c-di-GMP phosphodiesterase class II)
MDEPGDLDPRKCRILCATVNAVAEAIVPPDPYMKDHAPRVADYCGRVGRAMGLSGHDRFLLTLTARFHDIGMLSTPTYILRKASTLAEDEMEEVRVHPVKGWEIFRSFPDLAEIARAIRHHHERMDGSGYPDGLRGKAIPLFSRIILVADAFEAMTHHRPYRRAMTPADALRRLREGAGPQFDPQVVAHFAEVVAQDA